MTSIKRDIDINNDDDSNDTPLLKISKHNHENSNTTTTTTTIDNYFYSIWRNNYTRRCIRNKVFQDKNIKLDLEYLNNNHKYLSVLSDIDKIDNNISSSIVIVNGKSNDLIQLSNNRYRHLVNRINTNQEELDCDLLHEGLVTLRVVSDRLTTFRGNIPQSLLYLDLLELQHSSNVDQLLLNLPSTLKELELPYGYRIKTNKKIVLPQSLEVFKYDAKCSEIKKFVVPPNRIYKYLSVRAENLSELHWLYSQCWIINLEIKLGSEDPIPPVPSHIKRLVINTYSTTIGEDMIPKDLKTLIIQNDAYIPINFLRDMPFLKYLDLQKLDIKLEKGILPPTLTYLGLQDYNHPIEVNVLPEGLKELDLDNFDQELQVGVLPQSLMNLRLDEYQQRLKPFVLPNRLEYLRMSVFHGLLERNALPTSLFALELIDYRLIEAFENVDQLNNLTYLEVDQLTPSLVRVISKCKDLEILFESVDIEFDLRDTQIEHLVLKFQIYGDDELTMDPSFIPSNIKSLRLHNCQINSNNVVPKSCLNLLSDQEDLDTSLIPKTTKYQKIQKPQQP